jgi:hypothetical protein
LRSLPPAFAANNIHRGKKERRGVKEEVATAKINVSSRSSSQLTDGGAAGGVV